jgi:hypothetical protein
MAIPIRFETLACDLPDGGRRIVTGNADAEARLDFSGELAKLARTSPTFQRELVLFLMTALNPR